MQLPGLSEDEVLLLQAMRERLCEEIDAAAGALPFDRFMETALYSPGLGYYVNGRRTFGEQGDFVTAPEVSPLFSRCLARQLAEGLDRMNQGRVLEIGAGSGIMAADMLAELERLDALPDRYQILDLSPSLKALQQETLQAHVPHLMDRVEWLVGLPEEPFDGVVVGNELLDAMPVHRFRIGGQDWQELCVSRDGDNFVERWMSPRTPDLVPTLERLWSHVEDRLPGYQSEVNLRLRPWLQAVADRLRTGYVLMIDYGYNASEYYHPERDRGTLICHFRHRAYADPFLLPGLQDMTANVDFSAVARAAVEVGFDLAGYTTQAHFLIDSGLQKLMMSSDPTQVQAHMQIAQGVKKLTLPSEMGERFKVMMLARGVSSDLSGFKTRDLRGRL